MVAPRGLVALLVGSVTFVGLSGALLLGHALHQTPGQAPPVVTVVQHLRPCDDDAPGDPVTGACWLSDDGGVAIWPYPYAPEPLMILDPSEAR